MKANQQGQSTVIWVVIVAAIITLTLVALPTLLNTNTNDQTSQERALPSPIVAGEKETVMSDNDQGNPTAQELLEVNQLVENIEQYQGKTVQVRGEVSDVVTPSIYNINQQGLGGNNLTVITGTTMTSPNNPESNMVREGETRTVTGTIQRMDRQELEGLEEASILTRIFNDEQTVYVLVEQSADMTNKFRPLIKLSLNDSPNDHSKRVVV